MIGVCFEKNVLLLGLAFDKNVFDSRAKVEIANDDKQYLRACEVQSLVADNKLTVSAAQYELCTLQRQNKKR